MSDALRSLNLTRRQRQVCLLRYGRNQSQEQIARRLGISQPTVWEHLAAAARKYPNLANRLDLRHRHRRVSVQALAA